MGVSSRACMWACVLLAACSVNHNNPRCTSHHLLPQWSLPETRVWQVRVGSASQPCRADAIPTLQMGTPRLAEAKGPTWDSCPDSRVRRHSRLVPPPFWKVGLWLSTPPPPPRRRLAPLCRFMLPHPPLALWGLGGSLVAWWSGGSTRLPGPTCKLQLFRLLLLWASGKLASFHIHHLDLKSGDSSKTPTRCQVPRDLVSLDHGLREVGIIVPFSRWEC